MEVARGEAWWAAIASSEDPHPVLILTRDRVIPVRNRVTVAPISSTHRGVNPDDIVTTPKHLLVRRMTRVSLEKMSTIREAILVALGL